MSLENLRSRQSGFTLIELLVVIAIIGILSSVVLASLNSARQSSRDARRQTDMQQLSLALELYYDSCGVYPAPSDVDGDGTAQELATGASNGCPSGTTFENFMSTLPGDPQDDEDYGYNTNGDNSSYCLGTELESGNAPDNHVAGCVDGSANAALTDTTQDTFNYAIAP